MSKDGYGLTVKPRIILNFRSSYHRLLSVGVTDACHHAWFMWTGVGALCMPRKYSINQATSQPLLGSWEFCL